MKKIVISVLFFALSISLGNAQRSNESHGFEKLNLKSIESVVNEQGKKIDKESKALRINRNEYFKPEANEASEIALSYLQAKKDVYGLNDNLSEIKIVRTVKSPSGEYVYCKQYINGIPVLATNFTIYINKERAVTYALNEFRNVAKYRDIKTHVLVNDSDVLKIACEYLNIKEDIIGKPKAELIYFESIDKGLELAWKININAIKPDGYWQVFVSAENGRIIHAMRAAVPATGSGKVFAPNPLVSANVPYGYNNCYLHNDDANNPCLESQLVQVTLTDLTFENGVYKLKGPYCVIEDIEPPYGHNIPELSTPDFHYTRDQEEFEAVMCFYHVNLAANRILQLGYELPDGLKNLRVDPHGVLGNRNSYYIFSNPFGSNFLTFGKAIKNIQNPFVCVAEDADMIWHEYGHAIQFNTGLENTSYIYDTVSLLEGCSDYWATSYKRSLYPNNWAEFALWFDMNEPLCARRTDRDWEYPTDYVEGYKGGQIWSSALMKIWGDLGRDITDQLFLETHLLWGIRPEMQDAATAFMQADLHLYNGSHLCQIYSRFQEHGLINTNEIINTTSFINQIVSTSKIVFSCSDLYIQNVKVQDGAKLTLDAAGTITIDSDFEVELGSELEIK